MSTEDSSELQLWQRAVSGDGKSFGAVFDLHRDRVFRHAYRFLLDVHDAEDATAVAFLELWRRRRSVRVVDDSVLAWLIVATTHACQNLQRSTRRYRAFIARLPRDDSTTEIDAAYFAAHPFDGLEPSLDRALRSLGAVDLQLFVLVSIEGYPVEEAGAVLGLRRSAAKTRLHRIRTRLRATLAGSEPSSHIVTEGRSS